MMPRLVGCRGSFHGDLGMVMATCRYSSTGNCEMPRAIRLGDEGGSRSENLGMVGEFKAFRVTGTPWRWEGFLDSPHLSKKIRP